MVFISMELILAVRVFISRIEAYGEAGQADIKQAAEARIPDCHAPSPKLKTGGCAKNTAVPLRVHLLRYTHVFGEIRTMPSIPGSKTFVKIRKVPPRAIACRYRTRVLFGKNTADLEIPPLK